MSFTTALDTDIGKIRFWLTDDVEADAVFTDPQLDYCLEFVNGGSALSIPNTATQTQILLAASWALESNATRLAELATKEKIAIFSEDTVVTYESVVAQAQRLRVLAGQNTILGISTPDNFYQLYSQTSNPFTVNPSVQPPADNLAVW